MIIQRKIEGTTKKQVTGNMVTDRYRKILDLLVCKDMVTVSELRDILGVSSVTIRADLNQLAAEGQLVRTHGGARANSTGIRQEHTYATRQQINAEQKRCIGYLAASLVKSDEAILLDASTTAVAVGKALMQRTDLHNMTVVTTGIWTALELLGAPHINIVIIGGHVRETTGSIAGELTKATLSGFNFTRAFLGAGGINLEEGLTDTPLMEVELKQVIVQRSQEVNAIIDGSKFGRVSLASFASIDEIAHVITDSSAPEDMVDA
ncbi:MAG: DeoR/GlpR transcriptional regulator, partial [Anaerolineae bacterium]|nr:DeoR/GlpR transcriptional regulator [Anaerolineae bacterium]